MSTHHFTATAINGAAFGFRAYPSREIVVETSKMFQVVSRFQRAIGVITIVASVTSAAIAIVRMAIVR